MSDTSGRIAFLIKRGLVKYRSQMVQLRDIPGLVDFCAQKSASKHAFVVTKSADDFGFLQKKYMRIPAALICYWLGEQRNLLQKS